MPNDTHSGTQRPSQPRRCGRFIPPIARLFSLATLVTTLLYRITVSQALQQRQSILEAKCSRGIGRIPDLLGNFFPINSGLMLMTAGHPSRRVSPSAQVKEAFMSLVSSMLKVPKPRGESRRELAFSGPHRGRNYTRTGRRVPTRFAPDDSPTPPTTDRTIDWLHWIADHPDLANLTKVFELLSDAVPVRYSARLRPALEGALPPHRICRRDPPRVRLSWPLGVEGYETLVYALAQDGRFELTALADVVDAESSAPAIVMLLLFPPRY